MKILLTGMLCAAATALLASSLRHDQNATALHSSPAIQSRTPQDGVVTPVTVGSAGNEPLIAIAPDGTLYISALQHLYRSTDGGATWIAPTLPPEAQVNLNTDSSISVAPNGRLYFSFDYPYAGSTAVCTTDDKGTTWTCNPAVVPGGTDRMWVLSPTNSSAYEVTNEGLYETTFLTSTDGGLTWVPRAVGSGVLEPQTGPLLQKPCSTMVLQMAKIYGTAPSDVPELKVYVYDPLGTGAVLAAQRGTGLGLPLALPSGVIGRDGTLYVSSEEPNATGGRQVVVARSPDEGVTWTKLPPIPATETGTSIFSWVAADAPGHVGVIYYYTPDNGDPGTLTTSNWSTIWAESYNADSATPAWTVTTIDNLTHIGAICIAADCMGNNRFAGDFISAIIDPTGVAHLTWMTQPNGTGTPTIVYQRIQSGPLSIYQPPACGQLPLPVPLNAVVSRKTHGSAGTFDIDLPVTGPNGIECRSGGASNQHTVVFTFANPLHNVDGASVSSGTGSVSSAAIGADPHEYIVNLTGVTNSQRLTVTLTNVQDTAGNLSSTIVATLAVLLGDTNGDTFVNSADIGQTKSRSGQAVGSTNFRSDVTIDGNLNSGDIGLVKSKSGTALP